MCLSPGQSGDMLSTRSWRTGHGMGSPEGSWSKAGLQDAHGAGLKKKAGRPGHFIRGGPSYPGGNQGFQAKDVTCDLLGHKAMVGPSEGLGSIGEGGLTFSCGLWFFSSVWDLILHLASEAPGTVIPELSQLQKVGKPDSAHPAGLSPRNILEKSCVGWVFLPQTCLAEGRAGGNHSHLP